jgi:hypothetical protein
MGAAYVLDANGLKWAARWALAPVYPMMLVVIGLGGGLHALSGETRWMLMTAVGSFGVWFGILQGCRHWWNRKK